MRLRLSAVLPVCAVIVATLATGGAQASTAGSGPVIGSESSGSTIGRTPTRLRRKPRSWWPTGTDDERHPPLLDVR
jgi:hypothetical protein